MRLMWRLSLVVALCAGILASLLSCAKKSTKPEEKKGLRLYTGGCPPIGLYAIDLETREVVDSLREGGGSPKVISRDGRLLFGNTGYATIKFATHPLHEVARLAGGGGLNFIEDGTILLRSRTASTGPSAPVTGALEFIDPVSLKVTRVDSIPAYSVGSADTVGFVIFKDPQDRVVAYDFRNQRVLDADSIYIPDGEHAIPFHLALHPAGTQGYGLFGDSYYRAWFIVFKTPSLELEEFYQLAHPFGDVAVSPDGGYVLFDDPGDTWHGYPGAGFFVYDVQARTAREITIPVQRAVATPSDIVFSPDGTKAYVSCGAATDVTIPVMVFDMAKLEFVDSVEVSCVWAPGTIAVGPEP